MKVGLVVLAEEAVAPVAEGLRRDPNVAEVVLFENVAALPSLERSLCPAGTCLDRHPTVCAWARERGLDHYVVAALTTREVIKREPGSPSGPITSFHIHSSESVGSGPVRSYGASAALTMDVLETRSCSKAAFLGRRVSRSTSTLPADGGGPDLVKRQLLTALPTSLGETFPAQTVIDSEGKVRPAAVEATAPDGQYAVYRQSHFEGLARAEGVGTEAERLSRLTCCFEPRAGDVMVQRRTDVVFELAPTFSVASLAWQGRTHTAPGFGGRFRAGPVDRGWQGGVSFDLLYPGGASAFLATLEAGYHWRPTSDLTLALIAGGGGGFASTSAAGEANQGDAGGAHALAAALVSWQLTSDVYAALDLGYIHSSTFSPREGSSTPTFTLRGPLLRLSLGLH